MKANFKLILILFIALGVGASVWYFKSDVTKEDTKAESVKIKGKKIAKSKDKIARRRHVIDAVKLDGKTGVPVKPKFELDPEDEALLNEEQKKLIAAIREALDNDDFKALRSLVRRLQSLPEWPDGVPLSIRKAAINALAWFGIQGIPEIAGFLGDVNDEVWEDAISAYETALFEANGDRELSTLLVLACQAVNDADAIDWFLMELNNMRNSVAVETIKKIMKTGSAAAKKALPEAIEFFTAEENITTAEELDKWYNDPSGDNLDDPDDEDFYGPEKDDDE